MTLISALLLSLTSDNTWVHWSALIMISIWHWTNIVSCPDLSCKTFTGWIQPILRTWISNIKKTISVTDGWSRVTSDSSNAGSHQWSPLRWIGWCHNDLTLLLYNKHEHNNIHLFRKYFLSWGVMRQQDSHSSFDQEWNLLTKSSSKFYHNSFLVLVNFKVHLKHCWKHKSQKSWHVSCIFVRMTWRIEKSRKIASAWGFFMP